MLSWRYCPLDNEQYSNEEDKCEDCPYFKYFEQYWTFWYECTYSKPIDKINYRELEERLEIGL
jgi:hypothetical protein